MKARERHAASQRRPGLVGRVFVIEVGAGRSKRLPYNCRTRLARWDLAEVGPQHAAPLRFSRGRVFHETAYAQLLPHHNLWGSR